MVGTHHWRELPDGLSLWEPVEVVRWGMGEASDERVLEWPTMASPALNWSLTLMYLLFVWWGPKVMAKREAWNVKPLMIVYNVFVILLNAYMFIEILLQTTLLKMSWVGNPVDYSPKGTPLAAVLWWYYISKLIDYTDTFFLVVKKNNHQLSFLHVFHHAFMFWVWWFGIRFAAGGDSYFSAWVNCFVHIVMYSYYLGSCLGLDLKGKKHVTQLQLLQFVLVMTHSAACIYLDTPYPHWIMWSLIAFLVILMTLFFNFYMQEYIKKKNHKARLLKQQKEHRREASVGPEERAMGGDEMRKRA
eukprot:TRINITY_DN18510_c0_g1_i1.p1 TRINITY_DN18510_c0_g1~~TRINITY_DN18510_c0_g1_i1.p1  ORF type:complete len:302 (+),score=76.74 TRINITY_DN18510_c0_g1_i1:92-997(+)